jgi:7-carboxy-7-deazaguanine synthase
MLSANDTIDTTDLPKEKVFPVIEIFGPVIEGEGPFAGQPTTFIRFGYCDFRCSWCDSVHAVDPAQVNANAQWMTTTEICALVDSHAQGYPLITFSGGNPVVHDLTELVKLLHAKNYQIKVETQGSLWKPWLEIVDHIIMSPKPPSSGMLKKAGVYAQFLEKIGYDLIDIALKYVIFDQVDLDFALNSYIQLTTSPRISYTVRQGLQRRGIYLSCGTKATDDRNTLGERYAWLCETALRFFAGYSIKLTVLPQLHVVAYLHKLGV